MTPYGEIPWTQVSRLNDDEMKEMMIYNGCMNVVAAIATAALKVVSLPSAVFLSRLCGWPSEYPSQDWKRRKKL